MTNFDNNKKLPLQQIFIQAFQRVKYKILTFLKFSIPLVTFVLAMVALAVFNNGELQSGLLVFLVSVMIFAVCVIVLIGFHRTFLLTENEIEGIKIFRWGSVEWKFLGWWLLMSIIVGVIFAIIIFAFEPLFMSVSPYKFIMMIPIYYVISRWSLVFPATATESSNANLSDAWRISEGNGWRLTFLISFVPILLQVLLALFPVFDHFLYNLFIVILWAFIAVLQVGLLSLSFAFLNQDDSMKVQELNA